MPEGEPTPTPDPEPTPNPEPPVERTFTQTELDRIVQDRVARVKREEPEDYKELKAQAAKWAEHEEAQKTELQKAQDAAKKAEQQAATALQNANSRLVQAEILREATSQKALKPEHMHRLIDTESVIVGDDGQVTGVQEAVKMFLEANPEYVGKGRVTPDPVDQGARGGAEHQLPREALSTMTPEEIDKARKEGRFDVVLGVKK